MSLKLVEVRRVNLVSYAHTLADGAVNNRTGRVIRNVIVAMKPSKINFEMDGQHP